MESQRVGHDWATQQQQQEGPEVKHIYYCGLQPQVFENQWSRGESERKDLRVRQSMVQHHLYDFQSPRCPLSLSWVESGE